MMEEEMPDKGKVFRALHQQPGAFIIPNPWDVGTARILAALGFKALATTSAGMAFSLGLRDGQVGREAVLRHCRLIVAATELPVSADLEKGFGDAPESAAETVIAAAETGLAGCSIEDHTGRPDDPIYPFSLAVDRIAAAAEAARKLPRDFLLTARCENFLWNRPDLDETIKRLQAFEAAGADVLYAPGVRGLAATRALCSAVSKPVNVLMETLDAAIGVRELAEAGAKRISTGSALSRVALGAFVRAGRELADSGTFGFAKRAMGFAEIEGLLG
jgi:2-methylisocitrate lyase-like PEP mutase family enzyme